MSTEGSQIIITLTGCEHGTICSMLDILEELRLGSTRVSKHENINITTKTMLPLDIF
jgi:hypothetical protein